MTGHITDDQLPSEDTGLGQDVPPSWHFIPR